MVDLITIVHQQNIHFCLEQNLHQQQKKKVFQKEEKENKFKELCPALNQKRSCVVCSLCKQNKMAENVKWLRLAVKSKKIRIQKYGNLVFCLFSNLT